MKGLIFTEFLRMVELLHSLDLVDTLIEKTAPANGGAYTSVGNYPRRELEAMVGELSRQTGKPVPDLLRAFGQYLFARLMHWHPQIAGSAGDALTLMASIDQHIHVEVRKIYPEAELPRFSIVRQESELLELDYCSSSYMEDLAEGLMLGCLDYFGSAGTITREKLPEGVERFTIRTEALAG